MKLNIECDTRELREFVNVIQEKLNEQLIFELNLYKNQEEELNAKIADLEEWKENILVSTK